MGRQDARIKKREMRCKTKKWGDEMRDKKKMKRQDQYEEKWGDET